MSIGTTVVQKAGIRTLDIVAIQFGVRSVPVCRSNPDPVHILDRLLRIRHEHVHGIPRIYGITIPNGPRLPAQDLARRRFPKNFCQPSWTHLSLARPWKVVTSSSNTHSRPMPQCCPLPADRSLEFLRVFAVVVIPGPDRSSPLVSLAVSWRRSWTGHLAPTPVRQTKYELILIIHFRGRNGSPTQHG